MPKHNRKKPKNAKSSNLGENSRLSNLVHRAHQQRHPDNSPILTQHPPDTFSESSNEVSMQYNSTTDLALKELIRRDFKVTPLEQISTTTNIQSSTTSAKDVTHQDFQTTYDSQHPTRILPNDPTLSSSDSDDDFYGFYDSPPRPRSRSPSLTPRRQDYINNIFYNNPIFFHNTHSVEKMNILQIHRQMLMHAEMRNTSEMSCYSGILEKQIDALIGALQNAINKEIISETTPLHQIPHASASREVVDVETQIDFLLVPPYKHQETTSTQTVDNTLDITNLKEEYNQIFQSLEEDKNQLENQIKIITDNLENCNAEKIYLQTKIEQLSTVQDIDDQGEEHLLKFDSLLKRLQTSIDSLSESANPLPLEPNPQSSTNKTLLLHLAPSQSVREISYYLEDEAKRQNNFPIIQSLRSSFTGNSIKINLPSAEEPKLRSLIESSKNQLTSTSLEDPATRTIRLLLLNVPQHLHPDDINAALNHQFHSLPNPQIKFLNSIPSSKQGFHHRMFQILKSSGEHLLNQGSITISFHIVQIAHYVHVTRCTKCQILNKHTKSRCPSHQHTCAICSGPHSTISCPKTSKESCINCRALGLSNTNHKASSNLCPTFQKHRKYLFQHYYNNLTGREIPFPPTDIFTTAEGHRDFTNLHQQSSSSPTANPSSSIPSSVFPNPTVTRNSSKT